MSPFDNYIQIIDGTAKLIIDDKDFMLELGEGIIIPAHTNITLLPMFNSK